MLKEGFGLYKFKVKIIVKTNSASGFKISEKCQPVARHAQFS
jgi:hypothetical protein